MEEKIIRLSGVLLLIVVGLFFHRGIHTASPAFYRPDFQNLPSEIQDWIVFSKEVPVVQERVLDGKRYILITEGMKQTGGYSVEVIEVTEEKGRLVVSIESRPPGADDSVTQAITYPYDLIVVGEKNLPLLLVDVNEKNRHFMGLWGTEIIDRPIVASSDWIKVFTPKQGEEVDGSIQLSGIANVHEGTVMVELVSRTAVIFRSFTTAAFTEWGYFEEQIPIPQDAVNGEISLQLYSESMKDGSRQFEVVIPLIVSR